MKNYKFLIALIISILLHSFLLKYLKIDTDNISKDKPMIVDIIKPPKKETPEKPEKKPDILSDKNLNLKKKTDSKKEEPVIPDRKPQHKPKLKPQPQPQPKTEPKPETAVNKKGSAITSKDAEAQPQHDMQEKRQAEKSDKTKLSKKQMENIFNPSEIIQDYAEGEKKQKKGEDSVNFNSMENKYASYFYKFRRSLYQVWTYPRNSIMNNEQGRVRIQFSIQKDGSITNIRVVSSSGYPDLDRAAVDALKNMGKVPFENSFDINVLHVDGYFYYRLGGRFIN
ncbi:TonB family protein [Flexistipes sinusarabici DSM 4947]|uniref:TonB family protein n=1 Tax=Flexistipes sinusarabici (strain ATCC 49648 / DSM 4947 / MAS 10) TaxID=717231 RepID=F8E6H2_FLESM|nr:energy transducer TonB [Flexistipes sinusarabici]AEI14809.1 TonB family protein [Flexistipes sinusarabici DSM 4947]